MTTDQQHAVMFAMRDCSEDLHLAVITAILYAYNTMPDSASKQYGTIAVNILQAD